MNETTARDARALFKWISRYLHTTQCEASDCPSPEMCHAYLKDDGWALKEVETAFKELQRRDIIFRAEYVFSDRWRDE